MNLAPADFVVDHENWPAWRIFIDCATQWRMIPMGGPQGLDYCALEAVMRLRRVRDRGEMLNQVQLIERGALARFRGMTLGELYGR